MNAHCTGSDRAKNNTWDYTSKVVIKLFKAIKKVAGTEANI